MPRTHTGSRTNGPGDRARLGRCRVRPRARLLKNIPLAAFLFSLLFTPALLANGYPTIHWLGANGTSWTAGNNWSSDSSGSSPVDFSPNAYTVFSAAGSANSSATNLGGDQSVSSLTIAVPDPVGIGGGTLTVNGPVQIQTGTLTIGEGGGLVVAGSTPVPQTINALFAANNGANTVSVYNLDNSNLFVTSLGTGVLTAPTVLSADANGNLHVLNGTPGSTPKVSVFAPDGTLLREINSPSFPTTATPGFAVGQNGTLHLSDTADNSVSIFDSVGNFIRKITVGLDNPIGLATGLDGNLYVANTASSSISIFDSDGTPFGNATASFPSVLAASSNGTIYAPGGGVGDAIIELFFPDGLPAGNFTVSNSRNIKGLAVAPDGSFYASYEGSPAIHAFAPDGTPTGQITENLLSPYGLWTGNFTTETLQFNGITLAASSSDTATLNIGTFGGNDTSVSVAAHSIQFGDGTATLNLNLNGDFTLAAPLTGGGLQSTINKFGTGTTTLASADSTYAGAIHIHAGTLAITGSVANSSTAIHTGGTLAGDGILGSVEVHTGGTIAPGASGGTSTLTMGNTVWNGGGIFELQFASANGTPGSDWDFLSSTGSLTVSSTSGDKFVINATAQEGSGFDPAAESYKWQIANFSGNITGFAPEKFQILASGFNGSTGTFSVSANSTSLALNYRTLFVWSGGNGSWSVQTDWLDNAAPVEGGPIQFAGPGGISTNDSLASIASLAFTANATGSYTLDGGNLTIGPGGITNDSQHSQTIALNLAFSEDQSFAANSANLVVIGNITGAASLAKTGNQSLVLSGAAALTGNTTVFSGELAVTGGSLATQELQIGNGGNGTLHLSGGTIEAARSLIALFENKTATATITGGTWNNASYLSVGEFGIGNLNLTGGTVSVGNGTGTLDLAREVGSIGTLQIGNGTTAGTLLAANVAAGEGTATVNFHHNGDLVFAPGLTGNLALHQLGGTTTLTAANTHTGGTTITSGTLQIGNGGATGSVSGEILNDSALAIHRSDDLTFTNTLNGTGSVIKLGNNTLTYNSTAPQGGTFVNAGTLLVTGTTSSVTVNSTGTLAGTGTVGDVLINSGGAIAPGSSPGTITVANLTLESGAIYNWQTSSINGTAGTDWDLISSPGTLTLNATSGNPITIGVSTLGNATLAGVKKASWQIGNFTSGIIGFDAAAFTFDSSGMTGAIGRFFLSENSSALLLNYKSGVVWNTGSGNWSTTSQWEDNAPPVNGDAIEFSGPGGTSTNDGYLASVSGITFTSAANGTYTVNGTDLTIGQVGLVNDSNDSQTISINLVLGANQTFAANTANLIVSGNLSGNASLTKAGNQTLTLSGSNTYTGATTINAGTLAIGSGGSLNGTAKILVGNATSGNTLAILGSAGTGNLTLSEQVGSNNNTVTVGGGSSPASLTVSNLINVGFGGTGNTLDILGNGTVTAASTWIGGYGSNNTANVNGGVLNSTSDVVVGYFEDDNDLNITEGGNATVGAVIAGLDAGSSNNTILVSGSGSALHTPGLIYLGQNGTNNSLLVQNGGKVISGNPDTVIGLNSGSNGNALSINGTGSQFTNNGTFYVGKGGSENSLSIANGGSLTTRNGRIGHEATSSNNTATVSGAGSNWTNTGTLRVGSDGANNTLTVSNGANVTISGNTFIGHGVGSDNNLVRVSGAGSVLNLANATVGLSGSNNTLLVAVSGTINAIGIQLSGANSTLQIGNGAAGGTITTSLGIGTGSGTGHQVVFNHTDSNLAFSPILTGNLSVSQTANGTTALTADNTYTGGTTISAGTVSIGNGGTTGSIAGDITNNSALAFNRSDALEYAGVISGSGSLNKLAANTLTLTGNNTASGTTTISAGTLQLGNGGATGGVAGAIVNNATLAINRSDDLTFANTLTGTGSVIKLGTNTLTYNSTSPQGGTTVNAGTLLVTGTTTSVAVNNSGTLAGTGTVGDVTINSGGTIAPGNSPGTITVGNLTLSGGAIYNWQTASINGTAGTNWDLISSPGTLTLNGTSGSPITISLSTLGNATLAGMKKASWEIGNFTSGITGFDKSAFSFNATNMTGNAGGYFMSLGAGNTTLVLNYKTAATWNTNSGNWSTAAQWEGNALPENGDAIEFSGSGGTSTNNSYLTSAAGLTFLDGAGVYTVNGTALTLLGEGIVNDSAATQTVALDLVLGANQTFAANAGNLVVSGVVSGNGALTKSGNKTLTLSGNNIYTGGTVVSAGTLAGTTQSLKGAIVNNAVVNFDQTFNGTYTGVMSGAGSLIKTGTGSVLLSGTNTYIGGTTINAGALAAAVETLVSGNKVITLNPKAFGNGSVTINSGGAMFVPSTTSDGAHLTITGNLNLNNGAIAFYDIGSSPLSQDLRIDVTGNFNASAGNNTFDFSAVEALAAGNYTLVNAATVSAEGANFIATHGQYTKLFGNFTTTGTSVVYSVNGATSGGPNIQNNGGPNTPVVAVFDVTEATQTIGANNTVNSLNFTNNASLTIQTGGQLTLAGGNLNVLTGNSVISGGTLNTTGNLTKLGAGELDLVSNTTVNGTATVQAGLLSVNGQMNATTVVIDTGGTMGGNGTIIAPGGMRIAGTFAPGNSPGVISVVSNPVWESTSNTLIEIAGNATFDRIAVTGQATLAGNMTVVQFNGFQLAYGDRYDILTASGGITGNFSDIIMPGDFENSRSRFLINGTTGTLLIAPLSYVPLALNQNQRNVAAALDSFILANGGDRQTVSIALDSLTAAQYPAAFDAIMPGFYETLGDMVIEQAYNQTQLLNQRLSSVRLGATGFQAIGMSQPLKYDIDGDSVAEASTLDFVSAARGENGVWTPARIGRMAGSAPAAPAPYAPLGTNWNSWVMGIGEFAMSRGLSGVPNYNNNAGGFLAGADYRFGPTLSAGVYAGYQYNYAKYSNGSSTQGNSALFGLYASYANEGGYYADAVIGGGYTGFQTRRSIEFPGIDRTASADPGSGQFSAALNLGKDFQVGKFTLGPIVGAQYTYAGIGAFTESGADSMNLSLDQQNVNSLRTNLGARLAYNLEVSESIVLIPEVRGFWMHEFLNNPANITSSLNGGAGPSFDYETETPYRDSIFGGVGISARIGERWTASTFYNVNFGAAGYTNNILSATVGFSF